MALEKYTNTYIDVEGNIADADDILEEFDRVAEFFNLWASSIDQIGSNKVFIDNSSAVGTTVIDASNGSIQRKNIAADVDVLNIRVNSRQEGEPYRIHLVLRFASRLTTFTVSGPSGETHIFSRNSSPYSPGQTIADGWYPAVLVVTFGATNGCFISVFAENNEATGVGNDDVLTLVAQ